MVEEQHTINVYHCPRCEWNIITVDKHHGTTPMFIKCEGCGSDEGAVSLMYNVDQELIPTHEWYRPLTTGERKKLTDPNIREHVRAGGLLLRKIAVH